MQDIRNEHRNLTETLKRSDCLDDFVEDRIIQLAADYIQRWAVVKTVTKVPIP